ncbi:MAG: hypothetical protein JRN16_09120 [Nitrososphaerota archaeon]|nr:hypothetical protein [Nitrososphaerota archaeon]MDG6974677.1 hypothetical protein [Nitrososphaerota archaeon]MDG7010303.1 hypothetical protein [Nitrososphaerota archaeon]MDG7020081.1 hypothetical protein [Nitrososphaerota archaeon]MDG7028556.1 hypothetical protein [Nitrososphaerota archaeon]
MAGSDPTVIGGLILLGGVLALASGSEPAGIFLVAAGVLLLATGLWRRRARREGRGPQT